MVMDILYMGLQRKLKLVILLIIILICLPHDW